jgi:nitrogen fixation-related uncharacterized protein
MSWGDILAQLLGAAIVAVGVFIFAIIWAGDGEMK